MDNTANTPNPALIVDNSLENVLNCYYASCNELIARFRFKQGIDEKRLPADDPQIAACQSVRARLIFLAGQYYDFEDIVTDLRYNAEPGEILEFENASWDCTVAGLQETLDYGEWLSMTPSAKKQFVKQAAKARKSHEKVRSLTHNARGCMSLNDKKELAKCMAENPIPKEFFE